MTTPSSALLIAALCAAVAGCDQPQPTAPTMVDTATPAQAGAGPVAPPAFAACNACHAAGAGQHGIGPSLAGVYGRQAGAAPGFAYSPALRQSGLVWDEAVLDRFLADPRGEVPGTSMAYAGLRSAERRQAIIDWLKTI